MVTAGTYRRQLLFGTGKRRDLLLSKLFELAERYRWRLQAWAILSNHYHLIAMTEAKTESLSLLFRTLHAQTAVAVNREDGTPGRKVWFQYRDSHLTYPKSCFARLNYVHNNPPSTTVLLPAHRTIRGAQPGGSNAKRDRHSIRWSRASSTTASRFRMTSDAQEKRQHDCCSPKALWIAAAKLPPWLHRKQQQGCCSPKHGTETEMI